MGFLLLSKRSTELPTPSYHVKLLQKDGHLENGLFPDTICLDYGLPGCHNCEK